MDFDSDGGGISDGSEDINKNGILESGETDVYDADDDESSNAESINVPGNTTLYALGKIAVNDGVKCQAGKNFRCDIASESGDSAYAVNIGRGAEVRRIESKGGIFLRDYASVTGNIKIYSLPEKKLDTYNTKQRKVYPCIHFDAKIPLALSYRRAFNNAACRRFYCRCRLWQKSDT